jgi:preprotein translocase subunit SecB
MPEAEPQPALHEVQLAAVYLERIATRSSPASAEADAEPTVQLPRVTLRSTNTERTEFECIGRTRVVVSATGRRWTADVAVRGSFVCSRGLSSRELRFFVSQAAVYLLWPYARVYVDVVATLAGIPAPPLPLIVRPSGA